MEIEDGDPRGFLVRIVNTIAIVLIWMMANVYFGLYKDYAFFVHRLNWTNYLFYFLSAVSLTLLIIHLWRKWKL